jgi:hypothetical protein
MPTGWMRNQRRHLRQSKSSLYLAWPFRDGNIRSEDIRLGRGDSAQEQFEVDAKLAPNAGN